MDYVFSGIVLWFFLGAIVIGTKISIAYAEHQAVKGTGIISYFISSLLLLVIASMLWPIFAYLRWRYKKKS
ncbi:MAG: hypothetical protein A2806_03350 [Candidatus Terrybacteria bacterium RIFCSPHIGHO2_01_FULL_48_17]|uniref:Uncharacterized protein n=1 Tax=Candidatus Terrybacteria bacterium RIFCSPHIGHO2_01_FULL_48_17 TaxID=1802362 RepID=A0A1G2PH01_9BACT|nr:MAG: hypothetical protein A2806_03350 [Candidatus Terrybacteria bacterium RIFCSPHIGHO2_01_FULL_48_17]OHA53137.1 MAG: hypothetical protein A3A30_02110 [Candidatus Terrybacteria bacterium RIFCSPLOWO2_01_FULL_48_14]